MTKPAANAPLSLGRTLTFSATGLPAGLSINPATGQISGTINGHASVAIAGGVYSVSVTATDPSGAFVTRTFSWTVSNPAPVAGNDAFSGNETAASLKQNRRYKSPEDHPCCQKWKILFHRRIENLAKDQAYSGDHHTHADRKPKWANGRTAVTLTHVLPSKHSYQ